MTFIFVPSTPFSALGNVADGEVGPDAPTASSMLRRSSKRLHRRGVPGDAGRDLVGGRAEPREQARIVVRALRAHERIERHGATEDAELRAVLGRQCIKVVGELQAAGAGHVARDHRGLAGNVPAHVAGEHAGGEVVAPARPEADEDRHVAPLVEIRLAAVLRGRRRNGPKRRAIEWPHTRRRQPTRERLLAPALMRSSRFWSDHRPRRGLCKRPEPAPRRGALRGAPRGPSFDREGGAAHVPARNDKLRAGADGPVGRPFQRRILS